MGSNPAAPTSDIQRHGHAALCVGAAVLAYAVVLFAPQLLNDGDTYLHVAAGEWMLEHRAIPRVDPFSSSAAGAPWLAHEWLAELLMGLCFRLGGLAALLVMMGSAAALTFGLLAKDLRRWLPLRPAIAALAIAGCCASPSLLARPHLLAMPLLEIWTAGLLLARDRGGPPWRLLPLVAMWANLHGSYMLGLLLTLPLAAEALLRPGRQSAGPRWAAFAAAATLCACLTPWGPAGLLFPFELMATAGLGAVGEWQPPDFGRLPPIELALAVLLFVCLARGVRMAAVRIVILVGILHLALGHARHQSVAGLVGVLLVAEPVGRTFANRREPGRSRLALAALPPALLLLGTLRVLIPPEIANSSASPVAAVDHLPASLVPAPVLNDYAFGGYLAFRGIRPFIDSRVELYGESGLHRYARLMQSSTDLGRLLEARGIQWTIFAADSPAIERLDKLPGWTRLYADPVSVIHVRK